MGEFIPQDPKIAVIGLGYVGLPLALALARHNRVIGFDTAADRVAQLRQGIDHTGEVAAADLAVADLRFADETADIAGQDVYIVTVPTPVDDDNKPDLEILLAAVRLVGGVMRKGAVVVVESTVYPGVTRDICGPAIADVSGLTAGEDFFLGYSPERINPGDSAHGLMAITKVVAGDRPALTAELAALYSKVTKAGVFEAADIETAEAAKAIENAQRDINIAFVNEVALICEKIGLSAHEVLAAAGSKWNFLPFKPGLVGGHCIGVDPFYLAHRAVEAGHQPEMILAGRKINDAMGAALADLIATRTVPAGRVLVLGLTFKENVRDLRNSKVADLIAGLCASGLMVDVFDPLADPVEAAATYDIKLLSGLPQTPAYDAIVAAVPHDDVATMPQGRILSMLRAGAVVADIKGIWHQRAWPEDIRYWSL